VSRAFLFLVFCACATRSAERPYLSSGDYWKLVQRLTCSREVEDKRLIEPRRYRYGTSEKKRPLIAYIVDPAPESKADAENIYIIGAQHGDERNTKRVVEYFLREIRLLSRDYRSNNRIVIIPNYNPDGYAQKQRVSATGVDLNRDFPTSDGDEDNPKAKETRAFMRLMRKYPPDVIYNLHQPFRVVLYYPGDEELAKPFAQLSDYPLGHDVGYPTPGSLGTYGREKEIPVITVELSRSMDKAAAAFIFDEVRLALFHAAFGCIPKHAHGSRLKKYLAE
jgi:protein MpaA